MFWAPVTVVVAVAGGVFVVAAAVVVEKQYQSRLIGHKTRLFLRFALSCL